MSELKDELKKLEVVMWISIVAGAMYFASEIMFGYYKGIEFASLFMITALFCMVFTNQAKLGEKIGGLK